MNTDRSAADWYRSALPMLLLRELDRGAAHGYGLIDHLRSLGFEVKGATVYPHLSKLQADGQVEAEWHAPDSGPARKVLTITPAGRERLSELETQWARFRRLLDAAMTDQPPREAEPAR